ncbi:MAG TPA: MFS transporter [Methylocella sp.]|nr:MFS transporter [Methylocella sp.]
MMRESASTAGMDLSRASAMRFIVLLGVVSLFADMTYEGARSVIGPYLGVLGASAAVVGFVAGFGEFLGYTLRLFSGYLSDRTRGYWSITILGYGINLLAVPLLALAGRWELAILLILAERAGKAIRTPARDAMLSHAGSQTGLGFAFGLHGALDQTGAILGPLAVSATLYWKGGYQSGFAILAIPAVFAMMVLFAARHFYPRPHDLDVAPPDLTAGHLPRRFWAYLAAAALIAAGYADFPLIAFHFGKTGMITPVWIPLAYSLAMAAEAASALLLGRLFDKIGMAVMIFATLASSLSAPLAFLGPPAAAAIGLILWGIGMGAQASVMRAAIAPLAPASRRGTAYGVFNAAYGMAWFAGSTLLGVLYDWSVPALAAVSVLLQGAGVALLFRVLWSK